MNFLIISANKTLAHSIKSEFGDAGYRIRYAPNGELGLEIAQKVRFDLIVLDWRHPKEDDLRVLVELGKINLTPILILVAEDSIREIILSFKYCTYTCLTMRIGNDALIERIKALIPTLRWDRAVDNYPANLDYDSAISSQEAIEDRDFITANAPKPLYNEEIIIERPNNCKRKYRVGNLWECLVDEPVRCPNLISYRSQKFCLGKDYWDSWD